MKATWSQLSPLKLGLLIVLALGLFPELASAQPNALFPEIYVKRKRPCPETENPQYRMIREQFYGYYPTCWRRFPEGWGCQSADAPDFAASLAKQKLDLPTNGQNDGPGPDDGPGPFAPGTDAEGTTEGNSPFINKPKPKIGSPDDDGNKPDALQLPDESDSLFPTGTDSSSGRSKPGARTPRRPGDGGLGDPLMNEAPQASVRPRSVRNIRASQDQATVLASLPEVDPASITTNPAFLPPANPDPQVRRGPFSGLMNRLKRR